MRVVQALAVTIGVVAVSAIITDQAHAQSWWMKTINAQKCAEGNLKKCGKHGIAPAHTALKPLQKKAR